MISLVWFLAWGVGKACAWSDIPWLLIFMWLVLPIAHPCDYANYRDWWADRRNWIKKGYL